MPRPVSQPVLVRPRTARPSPARRRPTRPHRVRQRPAALLVGLALALLPACTPGETTAGPLRPTAPATSEAPATSPSVQETTSATTPVTTLTIPVGGGEVDVSVLPLVRVGDLVVATLDYRGVDMPGGIPASLVGGGYLDAPRYSGFRLVDLARDEVRPVATDAAGKAVATYADTRIGSGSEPRIQLAFAAPAADVTELGLFLPGAPYVPNVPVVDGEVPEPRPLEDRGSAPFDVAQVAEAPVIELEELTTDLAGAIQTETSIEEVVVNLGADVLFEVAESTLTAASKDAISRAAATISAREPGTVTVVGHTDDTGGPEINQPLSEARARAVAEALGAILDTSRYPLEASGRGAQEPRVPNDSEDNRARNRRVTLTLATTVTTTREIPSGELPPFEDGPVATGAEGVEIEVAGGRTFRFRAPRARSVAGHVVIDLELTATDDTVDSSFMLGGLGPRQSLRGGDSTLVQRTAGALRLLVGTEAVYPLDHLAGTTNRGGEAWLPLAELSVQQRLDGGQTRTISAVYPDLGDLGTVDLEVRTIGVAFRLTDVPVVTG